MPVPIYRGELLRVGKWEMGSYRASAISRCDHDTVKPAGKHQVSPVGQVTQSKAGRTIPFAALTQQPLVQALGHIPFAAVGVKTRLAVGNLNELRGGPQPFPRLDCRAPRPASERCSKVINRLGRCASLEDEFGSDKAGESRFQLMFGKTRDGMYYPVGKLAPNRCADLRYQDAPTPGGRSRAINESSKLSSGSRMVAVRGRAHSDPGPHAADRSRARSWSIPQRRAAPDRCGQQSG
jgi:hypothetical protein